MIFTSSYESYGFENSVSISGDRGKKVNFIGESYLKLAPKYSFWKIWHDNISKIPELENTIYYVSEYYNLVLKNLNPKEVYKDLDGKVLLCYEPSNEFCHRHIVACWLEICLEVRVEEVKCLADDRIIFLVRPSYIKDILLEVMNKS